MSRIRGERNTKPEMLLRSALHLRGLPLPDSSPRNFPALPDIVFSHQRIAGVRRRVFSGNGCTAHSVQPKNKSKNSGWKRSRGTASETSAIGTALKEARDGKVIRVWEHELKTRCVRCSPVLSSALFAPKTRLFAYLGSKEQPKLVLLNLKSARSRLTRRFSIKEAGIFTYFGDNKQPGEKLHETQTVSEI